jgi:hypothetical protein
VEITKNLGAFGKSSGIDITKMDCSKNYIVCRIEKFVEYKHQFYYLTEFQDEGVLSVYAENTFESFGILFLAKISSGERQNDIREG